MVRMNKTEKFIAKNKYTKLGMFLPTQSMYKRLDPKTKRILAGAVSRYQNAKSLDDKSKAFTRILDTTHFYDFSKEPIRGVRVANMRTNLEMDAEEHMAELNAKYGLGHFMNYEKATFTAFRDNTKKAMHVPAQVVQDAITEYEFYEQRDGNGYVVVDPSANPTNDFHPGTNTAHYSMETGEEIAEHSGKKFGFVYWSKRKPRLLTRVSNTNKDQI